MANALQVNCAQMAENEKYLKFLERQLLDGLSEAGVDYIHNGSDDRIPGNVSLSFKGFEGEALCIGWI